MYQDVQASACVTFICLKTGCQSLQRLGGVKSMTIMGRNLARLYARRCTLMTARLQCMSCTSYYFVQAFLYTCYVAFLSWSTSKQCLSRQVPCVHGVTGASKRQLPFPNTVQTERACFSSEQHVCQAVAHKTCMARVVDSTIVSALFLPVLDLNDLNGP